MTMIDAETCHCGTAMGGSDHCPECGCEEYERDCGRRPAEPEMESVPVVVPLPGEPVRVWPCGRAKYGAVPAPWDGTVVRYRARGGMYVANEQGVWVEVDPRVSEVEVVRQRGEQR